MITFNADEIFEMAEQIERNGARFYRKAAESAGGQGRDLLLRLAAMEDDHEKTFAAMRAELSEKRPLAADPDNVGALYLRAAVEGKIFGPDPSQALTGREPAEDVLNTAIGLEKDSIVFYHSMKDVVPPAAGGERLDAIMREEIGHILDLTNQLEALGH